MCWKGNWQRPVRLTAIEDLHVFKLMRSGFVSYYKSFIYNPGVTYHSSLGKPEATIDGNWRIARGFHSYDKSCVMHETDLDLSVYSPTLCPRLDILTKDHLIKVECIIPEGSEYYVNKYGEYVSDSIIIGKVIKRYYDTRY